MKRIPAHPLAILLIEAVLVIAAAIVAGVLVNLVHLPHNSPLALFKGLLTALAAVAAFRACEARIERTPDTAFTPAGAGRELALGLLVGSALMAAMAGAVWALGGLSVLGVRGAGEIWSMLALAIYSGPVEETLFRGVIFRHLETVLGTWLALALTAALFGFAHLINPDSTPLAGAAITIEAGVLLGAAYLVTRRLWLAIGLHSAWNFTQGWVFSVPVSGGKAPLGLLITRRIGPDWLTGGAFGLEASAVACAVATLAGAGLLVLAARRGMLRPMPWRAPALNPA